MADESENDHAIGISHPYPRTDHCADDAGGSRNGAAIKWS